MNFSGFFFCKFFIFIATESNFDKENERYNTTFRPNFGHFQVNGKNFTTNIYIYIYIRVSSIKFLEV